MEAQKGLAAGVSAPNLPPINTLNASRERAGT